MGGFFVVVLLLVLSVTHGCGDFEKWFSSLKGNKCANFAVEDNVLVAEIIPAESIKHAESVKVYMGDDRMVLVFSWSDVNLCWHVDDSFELSNFLGQTLSQSSVYSVDFHLDDKSAKQFDKLLSKSIFSKASRSLQSLSARKPLRFETGYVDLHKNNLIYGRIKIGKNGYLLMKQNKWHKVEHRAVWKFMRRLMDQSEPVSVVFKFGKVRNDQFLIELSEHRAQLANSVPVRMQLHSWFG